MVSSGSSRHAALLRALRWVAVSSLVADAACCVAVTAMSLLRRGSRTLSHRGARKALSHPKVRRHYAPARTQGTVEAVDHIFMAPPAMRKRDDPVRSKDDPPMLC
jgi:hypothetical protein